MDDEYISRNQLLAAYDYEHKGKPGRARELIATAPAADVKPVVRGSWVVSKTEFAWNSAEYPTHCKCSQCGREIKYEERENYCPNCGADMRGV